jgi:hypothetical protein
VESYYRAGFIGASTAQATAWVASQVGDAKKICVPYAGSGRDISSMSGEGRTIESWDTQYYSRAIVEGVFAAERLETSVDKIRYRKGYMFETRAIKNIDERSAGFIDWVAKNGTALDKASLGSAIIRSTLMGRMTQWYANVEKLYARFLRAREYNADWVNRPGTFIHHEASFHEEPAKGSYDLMQVDPPKVVIGSDVYSHNFSSLNNALGGSVELPKWKAPDVLPRFRDLLKVDTEQILFLYTSGVKPSVEQVRNLLEQFGTIETEEVFSHRGRSDYGFIVRRK